MRAGLLCCIGLGLCVFVLATCATRDMGLAGPALLALGLTGALAGAVVSFGHRRYAVGAAALLSVAVVVVLSLGKWYSPHWTPDDGGGTHWHSIWELGHFH